MCDAFKVSYILRLIKIKIFCWVGHINTVEDGRSAIKVLIDKYRGKIILRRFRRRWEGNIERGIKKYKILRVIALIQLRVGIVGMPL